MSVTFSNNLRLSAIASGTEEGQWGEITNHNIDLISDSFGYGEKAISDDAANTITLADAWNPGGIPPEVSDTARSFYLKITGTLSQLSTITMGPNTSSRVLLIQNGTSGGFDIVISQGSGSNVTITNGETKMVYMDGTGATANVVDAMSLIKALSAQQPDHIYSAAPAAVNSGGATLSIDWDNGNMVRINNTGNPASQITVSNPADGGNYALIIKAGTGATANWVSPTLYWPATFKWRNNAPPTLPTTVGLSAVVTLIYDGTNYLASYTLSHPA
ncbi:MAG: hypothetical protein EBV86_02605 [Marivivens sp.]|nr:hypothetical protein [Marivivens sp.]